MSSQSLTITEIEKLILQFLSAVSTRQSKDEIAEGLGISDIPAVVRALQSLKTQRMIRTFNRRNGTSFCAEYELAAEVSLEPDSGPSNTGAVVTALQPDSETEESPTPSVAPPQRLERGPDKQKTSDVQEQKPVTADIIKPFARTVLFTGIDPCGRDSIAKAFVQLKTKIASLQAPRSLCELFLDEGDFEWLSRWASNVSAALLSEYLNREPWKRPAELEGFTKREALGALLLLLAAEAARRESREGAVWPTFLGKFSGTARGAIAFMDGVNSAVRQSIEAAAESLRLRNVFGRTGVQYYYVSIFLQFGITRRGLRQLPYWLSGRPVTETIRYLMEGGSTYSQSFQKTWMHLVDFRNNRITKEQLKKHLSSSPWFLPAWFEELARLAKAQPGDDEDEWDDDYEDHLLGEPSFCWNSPEEPYFRFELGNTRALGLNDREYILRIEGDRDIRLRHTSDRLRASEQIRVPLSLPQPTLMLLDSTGTEKHRLELELWDPSEEITIFDLANGGRVDAFNHFIRPSRSYAILAADDLVPTTNLDNWVRLNKYEKICWYLVSGWDSNLAFNWPDGELCWQPNVSATDDSSLPFAVKQINVQCEPRRVQIGDTIHIVVNVPPSVKLKSMRLSGIKQDLTGETGQIKLQQIKVNAKIAASGFKLAMMVEFEGKKYRVAKDVPAIASGSVRWNGFSWEPVSADAPMEADDALSFTYKLFLPKQVRENLSDYGIFEGDSFCARLKKRRQPLGVLSGYGAPVLVRKMFNATPEDECIEVCSSVMNSGVVRRAAYADNVTIEIDLKRELELSEKHAVVIWPEHIQPLVLSYGDLQQAGPAAWQTICPNLGDFTALAVAYDGVRIGAQWPSSVKAFLSNASGKLWPGKIAAYLRWMGFPILARENFDAVREFAYTYPDEVLPAWLSESAIDDQLAYHDNQSDWLVTVRKLFRNWYPAKSSTAVKIVENLRGRDEEDGGLASVAAKLMACDPCLMFGVLQEYYRERKDNKGIHACLNAILHLTDNASGSDQMHWHKECLAVGAKTLRVDPRFLEKTAATALAELQGHGTLTDSTLTNIDSLLSCAAFRDYFSVFLLFAIGRGSSPITTNKESTPSGLSAYSDAELARRYIFKETATNKLIVHYLGDRFGAVGKTLKKEFRQIPDAIQFIRKIGSDVREPNIRSASEANKRKPLAFRKNPKE